MQMLDLSCYDNILLTDTGCNQPEAKYIPLLVKLSQGISCKIHIRVQVKFFSSYVIGDYGLAEMHTHITATLKLISTC